MSQAKPKESAAKVIVNASDLALLRVSNERGKVAQELVPVLREKIAVLERTSSLSEALVRSKDSSLLEFGTQVSFLQQINTNNEAIIKNKDVEIGILNDAIKQREKAIRRQKRKTVFVGIAGALASGAILYFGNK